MENKNLNLEQDLAYETEDIDMIKQFDDCEAGFLAKKDSIPRWVIWLLS